MDKKLEQLVDRAEELNRRRSKGALMHTDAFLKKSHWKTYCENTLEFYYDYHRLMSSTLNYLLVNYREEPPELRNFLLTSKIEKSFAPLDINEATWAHFLIIINYILAEALKGILKKQDDFRKLETMANHVFRTFWDLPENLEIEDLVKWQAYEILLDLAFGRHTKVIDSYNEKYKFDLAGHESSHKTIIKECYILSKIARGDSDEDMEFGARAYITLLKFNYYVWHVEEELSAEIALVPLVIICYLYEKITTGNISSRHDFYSALQPRTVLNDMITIKDA